MEKQRIVIIDDDETVAIVLQAMLEGAGYEVCIAGNSIEAHRFVFGDNRPALIILDVLMPFLSGGKVANLFKKNETTKSIPILYISGMSDNELQSLVVETDAAGYLTKPFSTGKVVEKVRGIIG